MKLNVLVRQKRLWVLVGYQLGRDDGMVSSDTVPATASKLSGNNRGHNVGPVLL